MFWKHRDNATLPDLAGLSGDQLSAEKTRAEIEKLYVETIEERSWRTKLLLSLLVPVVGVLAFLNTFVKDHANERDQRNDQNYTQAAQQLSSNEPAVRLNAVIVLESFIAERSWLGQLFQGRQTEQDCGKFESFRGRQSLALIVGHLANETDPSVLDQIAQVADKRPCLTLGPLLSLDRSAAVQFARAAADFTGLYRLRQDRKAGIPDDAANAVSQGELPVLTAITTRTGSPFQAVDMLNTGFVSQSLLELNRCPFRSIYDKQFDLTTSAGLGAPLRGAAPSAEELDKAMLTMLDRAGLLEKASYVLTQIANSDDGFTLLQRHTGADNLYGVAIVVGELKEGRTHTLQTLGAYVQTKDNSNTCPVPQLPQ